MNLVRIFFGIICAVLLTTNLSFSQSTDAALTTQSDVIRNQTAAGGNTRAVVANMFQGLIDSKVSLSTSYANPSWITSLAWSKITSTPTTLSGYGISDPLIVQTSGGGSADRIPYWTGTSNISYGPYWDNSNQRLGIGVGAAYELDIQKAGVSVTTRLKVSGTYEVSAQMVRVGPGGFSTTWITHIPASSTDLRFYNNGLDAIVFTADGRLYGGALHNNAGSVTGTTNQYIASGTYTPTLTNVTNVAASTAYACQWMRVGNVVTVSGQVDIDATLAASVATELGVSLPIASSITASEQLGGDAISDSVASLSARVRADATNDRAAVVFKAISLTNDTYSFTFTYLIL